MSLPRVEALRFVSAPRTAGTRFPVRVLRMAMAAVGTFLAATQVWGAPSIQVLSPADQSFANPTGGPPDLVTVTYQVTGNTCPGFRSSFTVAPYVNGAVASCAGDCGCDGTTDVCDGFTGTITLDGSAFSSCLNTIQLKFNPPPFCGPLCFSLCSPIPVSNTIEVWQSRMRDCTPPKDCDRNTVGRPVDVTSGAMYYEVTDLLVRGPLPVAFARRYDSQSTYDGPMGFGWQHPFLARLESAGAGRRVFIDEHGRRIYFALRSDGAYEENRLDHLLLSQPGSPPFRVTDKFQKKWDFDAAGKLTAVTDRNGIAITLAYSGSNLATITDAFGRSLSLTYDGANRVQTISGGGRTVTYTYNATTHNLTRADNSDGTFLTYEYTDGVDVHKLTAARDSLGHLIEGHTYYADGRVNVTQSDSGNYLRTLVYNSPTLTTVTNSIGNATTYTNDDFKGVVTQSSGPGCASCGAGGASTTLQFDAFRNITSITDGRGVITEMTYDGKGNVLTRKEAKGTARERTWTYTYHPTYNLPATISIPTVGSCGNPNRVVTNTYNGATGDKTQEQVIGCNGGTAVSYTTTWTYDSHGQVKTVDGPRIPADVTDVTTFDYYPDADVDLNRRGRPQDVKNALNQQTNYAEYDLFGNVTSVTDVNNVETRYSYNFRDQVTETRIKGATTADDLVTEEQFDAAGRPDLVRLPNCVALGAGCAFNLDYTFDEVNRLKEIRDSVGNKAVYSYDTEGGRTREEFQDPGATIQRFTNFKYDTFNRLQYVYFNATVPEGGGSVFYKYSYYADGTRQSDRDALGHTTTFDYDELKRLKTVTQSVAPDTLTTTYDYDALDGLKSIQDPNGFVTTYTNSDMGWRLSAASSDTGGTTYVYDAAGNMTSSTDANPNVANRGYDALNRIASITYPANAALNVTYTYDSAAVSFGIGRRTGTTDPSGSSVFGYDRRGLLISEQKATGGATWTTQYAYDKTGNLTQVKYPTDEPAKRQGQADFTYDLVDRISTIRTQINGVTTDVATGFSYKPFGPASALTFGNGLNEGRTFGTRYQPIDWMLGSLLSYTHAFSDDLNLATRVDNLNSANNRSFDYDEIHRLVVASGPWGAGINCAGSRTYTYDKNGNRLCKGEGLPFTSYAYTAGTNRLTSSTGGDPAGYTYDSNGNITGDGTHTYQFDQANRLTTTDGGATSTYVYDGDGRRVIKTIGGSTTTYFYDPEGKLLSEVAIATGTGKDYIYLADAPVARVDWTAVELDLGSVLRVNKNSPSVRLDWALFPQAGNTYLIRRKQVIDPNDKTFNGSVVISTATDPTQTFDDPVLSDSNRYDYRVLKRSAADVLTFYHADYLGTPIAMTNAAGSLVWRAEFLPFGGVDSLPVAAVTNNLRFPGQYFDSETGLHQNFFRDYSARTGRFMEPDPIGLFGGANIFAYADGQPTTSLDPTGLDSASPWQLGWEWLSGHGPRSHNFGPGDPFTGILQQHGHVQGVRGQVRSKLEAQCEGCNESPFGDDAHYKLSGLQGVPKYLRDYSTLLTGGRTGNLAVTFLGSYRMSYEVSGIDCCNGQATLGVHVRNSSTIASATHPPVLGYFPWWSRYVGNPLNSLFQSGPLSKTTQTFDWSEPVGFSGNPCCR